MGSLSDISGDVAGREGRGWGVQQEEVEDGRVCSEDIVPQLNQLDTEAFPGHHSNIVVDGAKQWYADQGQRDEGYALRQRSPQVKGHSQKRRKEITPHNVAGKEEEAEEPLVGEDGPIVQLRGQASLEKLTRIGSDHNSVSTRLCKDRWVGDVCMCYHGDWSS